MHYQLPSPHPPPYFHDAASSACLIFWDPFFFFGQAHRIEQVSKPFINDCVDEKTTLRKSHGSLGPLFNVCVSLYQLYHLVRKIRTSYFGFIKLRFVEKGWISQKRDRFIGQVSRPKNIVEQMTLFWLPQMKNSTSGLETGLQFLPLFCHLILYMKLLGSKWKYSVEGFLIEDPSILQCSAQWWLFSQFRNLDNYWNIKKHKSYMIYM